MPGDGQFECSCGTMRTSFIFASLSLLVHTTVLPSAESFRDIAECTPRTGLPNALPKLSNGGEVRVAYLGGSITEAEGWRPLSLKWLQQKYPKPKLIEINAAVSGTGSDFGAFRLEREVLQQRPDLLFVEFAVNDSGGDSRRIIEAMEGIVRKTWAANPETDICFVYTLSEKDLPVVQSGKFQRSAGAMETVADHYGIPSIHLAIQAAQLEKEGKLVFTGQLPKPEEKESRIIFSPDGTHPYVETGHPLYLAAIERSMPKIEEVSSKRARVIPPPLAPGNWERAELLPLEQVEYSSGWRKLELGKDTVASLSNRTGRTAFWVAEKAGERITLRFTGRVFGLYTIKGPDVGYFKVSVDGGEPKKFTVFDSYCVEDRYRIKSWVYPEELSDGPHTITIEVADDLPDKAAILAKANAIIKDHRQFDRGVLYVSDVMLLKSHGPSGF